MKVLMGLIRGAVIVSLASVTAAAFGCDKLPPGQTLWIRLATPVSTYTAKRGDRVYAVLTQDLVCDNEVVLPMGTPVEGVVRSKRKVGWGIWHETAALELQFNRAIIKSGESVEFTARVEEVENAREAVHNGVIEGILSSNTFQGRIDSRLIHLPTWNPYSDHVLIAYKAVFPIFPEPEIYYPAGTDLRLRSKTGIECPETTAVHEPTPEELVRPDELDHLVADLPWRVTTKKHVDADVVNVVFLGSRNEVIEAFHEAGWRSADQASRRSVLKNFYALLNNSGYPQQPMTTFLLNGKPEEMNWQKSLNSYGRRDHLRIWQWPQGQTDGSVWVSSSTHDTSAVLAVKHTGFVHHIAPDIDDERATVIRDLNFAGCVQSIRYVSRPEMPTTIRNATGDPMHTDGSVAVIALQHCQPADPQFEASSKGHSFKPGNIVFRYMRKQILTLKNDLWRENIVYGVYDVGRMAWTAMRHDVGRREMHETVAGN